MPRTPLPRMVGKQPLLVRVSRAGGVSGREKQTNASDDDGFRGNLFSDWENLGGRQTRGNDGH